MLPDAARCAKSLNLNVKFTVQTGGINEMDFNSSSFYGNDCFSKEPRRN